MSRKVVGQLIAARVLESKPPSIPEAGASAAQRLGRRYENSIGRALPFAKRGIWWEYVDFSGIRFCQTDFLLEGKKAILVLEAKNTYSLEAWEQLERLYLPVVGLALGKKVLGIQICRRLVPGIKEIPRPDLRTAIADATIGKRGLLHWTGIGRLWEES